MAHNLRITLTALLCVCGYTIAAQQNNVPNYLSTDLTFVWESKPILEIPESVFYDAENQCLYVSNIKGSPSNQDGNGYLSKLNLQGKIIQQKWVSGMDAPKGIAKYNNYLYVSDINDLVVIDITKQKIVKKYHGKEAKFLNDVTVDPQKGIVYVSDMMQNCIYRLKDDKFEKYLDSEQLNHVNGLFFEDDFLYAGVMNQILKIDPKSKQINTLVDDTGNIDGLIGINKNEWIISDWTGNVQRIQSGKITKLLSTADQQINAADLGYIPDQKIILVPTFHNNRIVAYQIK
ncbi:ATP-binding protein [Ancylomarina longa]|uniref:ATP-binding protein n=1 Tax=Ancylomarina longa TaxID=2487017 RepID=A0A434AXY4_9BACT|nr:ATP-binding protein [Ancylomarina longa]RUT79410.1 ATP-binding protein [Ancylomarina longa]